MTTWEEETLDLEKGDCILQVHSLVGLCAQVVFDFDVLLLEGRCAAQAAAALCKHGKLVSTIAQHATQQEVDRAPLACVAVLTSCYARCFLLATHTQMQVQFCCGCKGCLHLKLADLRETQNMSVASKRAQPNMKACASADIQI